LPLACKGMFSLFGILLSQNKVLYIKIPCMRCRKQKEMLKKMEVAEHSYEDEENDLREKIEITLRRLQELKEKVAELRRKCEELRQTEPQHTEQQEPQHTEQQDIENTLRCEKCGRAVDPEQQIAVKDADGVGQKHYHKECFQTLLK
jgi:TolA-binding protein